MESSQRPILRTASKSVSTNHNGNGTRSRPGPSPLRVSMEEYYLSQAPCYDPIPQDSDVLEDPPSYGIAINGLYLPATRLKIQPREDLGQEPLPAYSCSIMIGAVFEKKMELEAAIHRAFDRNWHQVFVELQDTALRIYKVRKAGIFAGAGRPNTSTDLPSHLKPGQLLKIYSLQYADVGIAADYWKRQYVIRIRVEADQFLLSCLEIETFLLWLESLTAAINLAPPLDERKLSPETSYSCGNHSRDVDGGTIPEPEEATLATPAPTELWLRKSRNHNPSAGEESDPPTPRTDAPQHPHSKGTATSQQSSRVHELSKTTSSVPRSTSSLQHAQSDRIQTKTPQLHSDITPEGKWRPVHNWTPRHDIVHAKRCMKVLLSNTPREANLVIMRGRRWIVNWATGTLTLWEPEVDDPPLYTELIGLSGSASSVGKV